MPSVNPDVTEQVSCSWCHRMNPAGRRFCPGCGHSADRPRLACVCEECRGAPAPHPLTEEDVALAIAWLEAHRTNQEVIR